jgi:uncharacterized membrane protein
MNVTDIAVAIFNTHSQAEDAVRALQRAGVDMRLISIIGQDYQTEEHVTGYLNMGDRVKFFGKLGAFWGSLAGILFGSAVLFIPVAGNLILLGPLAAAILGGLEGAVVGGAASALMGALTSIGIPKDSILRYETAVQANKYLIVLHGDKESVLRAQQILRGRGPAEVDHHDLAIDPDDVVPDNVVPTA